MRRSLLLAACLFLCCTCFAQISPVGPGGGSSGKTKGSFDGFCPRMYFGVSTGFNNAVGFFGPQVDVALNGAVSLGTGFGLSTWGYKLFGEGRFYFDDCNRGWALGAGITYNTGIKDLTLDNVETYAGRRDVSVELHPQTNVMLSAYRFFRLGKTGRNRWHLQLGGSIPVAKKKFTQLDSPPMTGSAVEALETLAPGGLVFGIGFSFGAGRITQ